MVFFAKEGDSTGAYSFLHAHLFLDDRQVIQDRLIDEGFDLKQILPCNRPLVLEIKAQAVGRDEGSFLGGLFSQDGSEGRVKQMGGRVVAGGRLPFPGGH